MYSTSSTTMTHQNDFWLRIFSITLMTPLFLWLSYKGGVFFNAALLMIFMGIFAEWFLITKSSRLHWFFLGSIYILIASYSVWNLVHIGPNMIHQSILPSHTGLLFFVYVTVWGTDCGAYITGRILKGPKLCPSISPNKTLSGFLGGLFFGWASAYGLSKSCDFNLQLSFFSISSLGILLSLSAHMGDLLESAVKRYFGVKDASNLIPGHGGLLDRMDSLMFVSIICNLIYFIFNH